MIRFPCRSALIAYAQAHAPSRACARAFVEGPVVVLGGFSSVPPGAAPGWLLTVKSKHGRTWIVAVTTDEVKHTYRVWLADRIPWANWIGDRAEPGVYRGDVPDQAARARVSHGW